MPKKVACTLLTHCDPEKLGVPTLSELHGSCNEKQRSPSPVLQLAAHSQLIFDLRGIPRPTQAKESHLTRDDKAKNINEGTKSALSSICLLTFCPGYLVICLVFLSEDKKVNITKEDYLCHEPGNLLSPAYWTTYKYSHSSFSRTFVFHLKTVNLLFTIVNIVISSRLIIFPSSSSSSSYSSASTSSCSLLLSFFVAPVLRLAWL